MIIIGFGKDAKKIADAGDHHCPRCHNQCLFQVVEIANRLAIFFIPAARWQKKYFLSCSICHYSYPLGREELEEYTG